MNLEEAIKKTHRLAATIGYSVFGALVLYFVLEELIRNKLAPFYGFSHLSNHQTLRYIFYGLSAISIILARLLQSLLLRKKPGDTIETLLDKLHRTSIIMIIMSELPALFGLFLFLLVGLNRDFYILLIISVAILFIFFPRRRAWEEWVASQI
ncbi:MAG TPA: hypothetical protein PLP57_00535 [Candidatus Saccharicenans sp.]|jgi:hypothetical protein|nr:hypothetical protein [Candidatus Saccharicenans sp.]HRD01116.1 hypothetical protein [Candidatus Saccharicenans sp.]